MIKLIREYLAGKCFLAFLLLSTNEMVDIMLKLYGIIGGRFMANDLVERLRDTYGNLTSGAIERADLDGMAFAVQDAIKALEAADEMASKAWDIIVAQGWQGSDFHFKVHTYLSATQKGNGDG